MQITVKQYVEQGYRCPSWYGLAYWEPDRNRGVYYPIPLHWVFRWGYGLWWAFKLPKAKVGIAKALNDAEYRRGYVQGMKDEEAHWRRVLDATVAERLPPR